MPTLTLTGVPGAIHAAVLACRRLGLDCFDPDGESEAAFAWVAKPGAKIPPSKQKTKGVKAWYDSDTKQTRYQASQPGTGRGKKAGAAAGEAAPAATPQDDEDGPIDLAAPQEEQPAAPDKPAAKAARGKAGALDVDAFHDDLKALTPQTLTTEKLGEIRDSILSGTAGDMKALAARLGLKGVSKLQKSPLADRITAEAQRLAGEKAAGREDISALAEKGKGTGTLSREDRDFWSGALGEGHDLAPEGETPATPEAGKKESGAGGTPDAEESSPGPVEGGAYDTLPEYEGDRPPGEEASPFSGRNRPAPTAGPRDPYARAMASDGPLSHEQVQAAREHLHDLPKEGLQMLAKEDDVPWKRKTARDLRRDLEERLDARAAASEEGAGGSLGEGPKEESWAERKAREAAARAPAEEEGPAPEPPGGESDGRVLGGVRKPREVSAPLPEPANVGAMPPARLRELAERYRSGESGTPAWLGARVDSVAKALADGKPDRIHPHDLGSLIQATVLRDDEPNWRMAGTEGNWGELAGLARAAWEKAPESVREHIRKNQGDLLENAATKRALGLGAAPEEATKAPNKERK